MRLRDTMIINGSRAHVRTYAKINLTLDVLSKRVDGYHDISSVMQTVSLSDEVTVEKHNSGIYIYSAARYVPCDRRNIAYRAAEAFFEYTGMRGGVRITLHKHIPVAAGLAGGSGDGAAVITALDALYDTCLRDESLYEIGARIGADIPYCFNGGTQLAQGIGEVLTPLADAPKMDILLVKPNLGISTAAVYEEMDSAPEIQHPDTEGMLRAVKSGSAQAVADKLCNAMEAVTERQHPQIAGIKQKMMMNGALGAVMSGSGPTVFGIFPDAASAKRSADSFYYQFADTYIVKTI